MNFESERAWDSGEKKKGKGLKRLFIENIGKEGIESKILET